MPRRTMPDTPPRALPYLRVSSDDQATHGAGLGAQADACRDWAAASGLEVVGPFAEADGVSGATPLEKRPALVEALGELKAGDVLVVWKRDRIARDVYLMLVLEQLLKTKGCRLVSTKDEGTSSDDPNDPAGLILRTVSDLVAQLERLHTMVRTRVALARKRREGQRTGGIPFGWDLVDDGRKSRPRRDGKGELPVGLSPNEEQQRAIRLMLALRANGWTYDKIAWSFNRQSIATKTGVPWTKQVVKKILARAALHPPTAPPLALRAEA